MKRLARTVVPLLLTAVPLSASAGFGFGMSDDGFNTWDPEDYPYGYPVNPYNRWNWGPDYRSFIPPQPTDAKPRARSQPAPAKPTDDGWGKWGDEDDKRLKFGTGNFNFGDAWKPSFGDSWGKRRARPMPRPPYGYYPPAPGWGGYPPAPPWGGYAAPAPQAPQAPAAAVPESSDKQ